ncbi:MAG: histidine triad nucleotide-binding protein [Rickettsiales bacterium]|jgi:histidine triad (HIT) family protein|nr:histidine triad nucleotide-binding protein [Rickettsiales bacterium]
MSMIYDKNNVFAKILRGEIPCNKVYEDGFALAFHDIAPAAPVHVLVIPKGEYLSFQDFATKASPEKMQGFFYAVQKVASQLGIEKNGYRLISNHGKEGGQVVPHFHVHLLAGKPLGGLVAA